MSEKTLDYLVSRIRELESELFIMKTYPIKFIYRGLTEYQLNKIIDFWQERNPNLPPKEDKVEEVTS